MLLLLFIKFSTVALFVVNALTWSTVEQRRNIFIHIFPWILFHE